MRKDLKIGMAVGGVFLLVVIAYLVVHRNSPGRDVALDKPNQSTDGAAVDDPIPALPPGENSSTKKPEVASGEDASKTAAPADPWVNKSNADTHAPASERTGTDTAAAESGAPKSSNWGKILQTAGDIPPMLSMTPDLRDGNAAQVRPVKVGGERTQYADASASAGVRNGHDGSSAAPRAPLGEAATPPTTQPHPGRTHTIRPGETFSTIAKAVYGNSRYYVQIANANPTVNPTKLRPNMVINLPAESELGGKNPAAPKTASGASDVKIDPRSEYKVQQGDSLYRISLKCYGRGDRAGEIYQLNKSTIGADSAKLKIDMVLKLPAAPTATASR